jgi:hypothetical protein
VCKDEADGRGSFETPLARRTKDAQHCDTERAWQCLVVDKNKHKKMTDHVAEQIELKFKAATVPQPPTKLVWPIPTTSAALAQPEMVLNQVDAGGRCVATSVTHLRGCTWQPIFRVVEVLSPEGGNILLLATQNSIKRKHRGGNLPHLSGDGTEGLLALVEVMWPLHALY